MEDLTSMSSNYANLAGILAGFSFSGIYLLIEYEKRDASEVISILLVGFFGLILSAFLFSNISKMNLDLENLNQLKKIGLSVVISSIIFCIAIMQMFLSLVFIFILYRLPKQVISLGKILYYETSIITTLFIITTIPRLFPDENIIPSLSRDLLVTALLTIAVIFTLSKMFIKKLDILFEDYFIQIVAGSTVLMLILVGIYRSDIYLREIPAIFPHILIIIFTINIMINNFSINHEYRMMKLKDSQELKNNH